VLVLAVFAPVVLAPPAPALVLVLDMPLLVDMPPGPIAAPVVPEFAPLLTAPLVVPGGPPVLSVPPEAPLDALFVVLSVSPIVFPSGPEVSIPFGFAGVPSLDEHP
jgi:hypothetical protein